MKKYLFIFFALLSFTTVTSQSKDEIKNLTIDSIIPNAQKYYISQPEKAQYYLLKGIELAEEEKDYYKKGLFLTKMITQKNRARDFDSAKFYFNKAKKFITSNKDAKTLLPDVHSEIAETYYYQEELDKALTNFSIADSLYNKQGDSIGVLISKSNIANVYQIKGNFELAINNLLEAAKNVDTTQYKYIKTDIYNNISALYQNIDDEDKSLEYALKCLDVAITDKKYPNKLAQSYMQLAGKYRKREAYVKAQTYLDEGFKIVDSLGFESLKFNLLTTQSAIYISQNKFKEAQIVIEEALGLGEKFKKNNNEILPLKINLSHTLNEQGNYDKAINVLLETLKSAEDGGRVNDIADIYKNLSESYANVKNYKNAYLSHKEYFIHNDSILGTEKQKAIKDSEVKYDTAEKQKQILIQRAELAEQDLVIQKRNYQVFGLASLALILGLIGFLFYNQQKLRNAQLQKENELKDALLKIETQNKLQEQRLRISRDLHDNIGAQLTFIISSIDNLKYGFDIKDEKLNNKLETISDFTSGTIYELRDTIWAMNKSEITFEDLQTRISNYIDKAHLYDSNIQFNFKVDESVDTLRKFTSVEGMNIHRVIQEAIHNSLKYADASKIEVEVSKVVSNLVFKILDNGKGFDLASIKRGNGLNNMEKRVHNIGGEFQINSAENKGTEVIITI